MRNHTVLARLSKVAMLSPQERREALRRKKDHIVGSVLLGWIGCALNRANHFAYLSYVPDSIREYGGVPDFGRRVSTWTRHKARRNAGDLPRLLFLLQNTEYVIAERIPGQFAELGVHKGHSAKVLAEALIRFDPARRLYLFDTFDGFDVRDLQGIDAGVARMFSDTSLGAVKRFVGNAGVCDYRPGHFPASASEIDVTMQFAFVHLDCDLYEPMRSALAFFYPRLSAGAFVVIHDYHSGHWPGVTRAVTEFLADKPERLVLMPDKSGTAVFRKV